MDRQQARNLLMDPGGQADRLKFMIRDRGPDFTAAFDAVLADAKIGIVLCNVATPRMNAKAIAYDNAAAEAVNSLSKKELINHEGPWQDAGHVTVATAEWVSWYNNESLILPARMFRQQNRRRPG